MKKLLCFSMLFLTIFTLNASPCSANPPESRGQFQDIVIKGRAERVDQNSVRCKGRRGECARIVPGDGSTMEFVIYWDASEEIIPILSYSMKSGVLDDETEYTDITYIPEG